MKRLIECVPNFSEGRDAATVDAIVAAMSDIPGATVLDRQSDADHNRSVVTLAGEPEAVAEAVLRGIGAAAGLIDMRRQRGAHPRIGATDVVPFIPIEGCTIEDCVELARRVGRDIWERYRIPVYFYEAAAKRPERINLEDVRNGQFEGLRSDVMSDPDRSPDIGEPRLHATAGAIAVGARKLLIAYNIQLNTNNVSVAKQIARAIRFSSGGLRYVKAMGVALESRNLAQVSVNLTDFEQTPLHRVFEMVKREAERHGCAIAGSQIVGLIPRKAIELASEFYLRLENFSPALVLENRLSDALGSMPAASLRQALELSMESALAAVEVFEKLVQLERLAPASILPDLHAARLMAAAAVRGSLANVAFNLALTSPTPGHATGDTTAGDSAYVLEMKSRAAAIEERLAANPVPAEG